MFTNKKNVCVLFFSFTSFGMQETTSPPNDLKVLNILYETFGQKKVDDTLVTVFRIYKKLSISSESRIFKNHVLLTEVCFDLALSSSIFSVNSLIEALEANGSSPGVFAGIMECDSRLHDNFPRLLFVLDDIKKIGKQLAIDYRKYLHLARILSIDMTITHERLVRLMSYSGATIESFFENHFDTPARQTFFKEHYNGCIEPWRNMYDDLLAHATPD